MKEPQQPAQFGLSLSLGFASRHFAIGELLLTVGCPSMVRLRRRTGWRPDMSPMLPRPRIRVRLLALLIVTVIAPLILITLLEGGSSFLLLSLALWRGEQGDVFETVSILDMIRTSAGRACPV